MSINFKSEKKAEKWAENVKAAGQKILVVYQPITSNLVAKKFYESALHVMSAANLMSLVEKYGVQTKLHINSNFPIDFNRNDAVDTAINSFLADYIFFMDTDQTFPSNCLKNMFSLISEKHPVVAGVYHKKSPDYAPVIGRYAPWTPEYKSVKHHLREQGFVDHRGNQTLYWNPVHFYDRNIPFYADLIGAGCMLVDTKVFKKLQRPYFRYAYDPLLKDPSLNKISEDMWFCAQLKNHDIPILIDPRVQCGHLTEFEVNDEACEQFRTVSLAALKEKDPERHDFVMKHLVDVREEQKKWAI